MCLWFTANLKKPKMIRVTLGEKEAWNQTTRSVQGVDLFFLYAPSNSQRS